jgi:hypothetical protein
VNFLEDLRRDVPQLVPLRSFSAGEHSVRLGSTESNSHMKGLMLESYWMSGRHFENRLHGRLSVSTYLPTYIPTCLLTLPIYVYTHLPYVYTYIHTPYLSIYLSICTGCPRRNVPDFGRVFLRVKYTDITQNTFFYFLQIYNLLYKLSNKQICYKETLVRSNRPMMILVCILYVMLCLRLLFFLSLVL